MPDVLAQDDVLSFNPGNPFLTAPDAGGPPPVAASRSAVDMRPQIEDANQRSQAAIDAAQRSMDLEERNAEARQRELEPLRQRQLQAALSGIDRTEAAQKALQAKTQKPPEPPKRQNQHDDENWLFASALLGSLAGALTRNHQTNALAAFTGAMTGYQEGSRQKFDQNMEIWKAENQKAIESNKQALDEYRAILENTKLTNDQMSVALQVAGSKYEDKAMVTAAKTKNELLIAQLHDKRAQAMEQMSTSADRLTFQYDQMKTREQTQLAVAQMRALGVTPGQENALIDAIGTYKQAPIGGPRGAAIMNLVQQAHPDYDIAKWYDQKARATIAASADRAGATSAARTFGPAGANTEIVMSRAGPVLTNAAEAANAVPATEFKRINQLYQAAAEEISDPAVRNFKVANEELAALFAAVNNPRSNVITVSAMEHARGLIAASDGPEAYAAILHNIQRLAEREASVIRKLRAGGEPDPINIPPISPSRQSSVGGMVEGTIKRTDEGINKGAPTAEQFWKDMHPPLSEVPGIVKGWFGNQQKPAQPPQSSPDTPIMLPGMPGWSYEIIAP